MVAHYDGEVGGVVHYTRRNDGITTVSWGSLPSSSAYRCSRADFAIGIARGRHRSGDWGVGTSTLPLLKIQLAVGFIVNPSFKIRAQGGLDLPGYEIFSITGVVFLGAR